ncbi:MAG: hypothetical protein HUU01_21880 [Saprospiraceae bacterium]|nr:hypothetical protein [Saprospiraceae bacterium]
MYPFAQSALSLLLVCLFCYCQPQGAASPSTPAPISISLKDTLRLDPSDKTYAATKAMVNRRRQALHTAYAAGRITLDSVRQAFTSVLLDDIIPYWYGTDWSFEGHTTVPRSGQIACGYFVSTTLLDAGVRLNRYRLAQQAPETEARMLNLGKDVLKLESHTPYMAAAQLEKQLQDGLCFIGMGSSHVGYLLKRDGQLTAIHSNYVMPSEVVAQPIMESVYVGFGTFYLADITWNDQLLKYWLKGGEVPTAKKKHPSG